MCPRVLRYYFRMAAFTPALAEVDGANFGAQGEEREKACAEPKGLSGPEFGAVWCYQTHHISPLEPLFVCLHNRCLPRYSDKESMKVTFHW